MDAEQLNQALYDKMAAEQERYRHGLLGQTPEEVLKKVQLKGENFVVSMKQNLTYTAELSDDVVGNIARINNALERITENLEGQKRGLVTLQGNLENAKEEAARPFPQEEELAQKSARLSELNVERQ